MKAVGEAFEIALRGGLDQAEPVAGDMLSSGARLPLALPINSREI